MHRKGSEKWSAGERSGASLRFAPRHKRLATLERPLEYHLATRRRQSQLPSLVSCVWKARVSTCIHPGHGLSRHAAGPVAGTAGACWAAFVMRVLCVECLGQEVNYDGQVPALIVCRQDDAVLWRHHVRVVPSSKRLSKLLPECSRMQKDVAGKVAEEYRIRILSRAVVVATSVDANQPK